MPTDAEIGDWADRLALEIALDMQRLGNRDARELTAARLRLVRLNGELAAANKAVALAVGGPLPAVLHGWAI